MALTLNSDLKFTKFSVPRFTDKQVFERMKALESEGSLGLIEVHFHFLFSDDSQVLTANELRDAAVQEVLDKRA